ncbi:MAG: sodium-dependent transporter [Micrococcales bacterium]|nr:sodium-dependent transporter [Micrococcales bacterium]
MSSQAPAAPARQQWSGQYGFIISAIGSAVGLGNIWRFPGVAYENGGGAFLIPYLIALLTAGIPILFLDYALGHRFRGSPPLAFRRLGRWFESLGWFQVMICFFIAVYYAAVLAWAGSFFFYSFGEKWGDDTAGFFLNDYLKLGGDGLFGSPVAAVLIPLAIIWAAAIVVLAFGVKKGVERTNVIAIPALVVAFLVLVVRSLFLPGAKDGLNAFFTPDFSALGNASVWVSAYAQIFFSLSIAFGIMITYSSYRKRRSNQTSPGLVVAFANSSFEILAGIGVFSILGFMANQQGQTFTEFAETNSIRGPFLSFVTFPKVVSEMPQAWLFGALFFGSLMLAGFTSFVSILQVISGSLQDKFHWSARKAAILMGSPLAVISLVFFSTERGLINLDNTDKWSNEVGIVLSAVVMMILTMWVKRKGREFSFHLSVLSTFKVGTIWRFLVTVVGPIVLGYMLVTTSYDLITNPDGDYATTFQQVYGWFGVIGLGVAVSFLMPLVKWKDDPMEVEVWPAYGQTGAPMVQADSGKEG